MNEQKTAILIDSGCDLSEGLRKKYDIRVIPFHIIYPEGDFLDTEFDAMEVYARFPSVIPTTSTPSVAEIRDALDRIREEGYENVLAFTISANLSGTYNAVRLVVSEYEGLNIFAFNTRNVSIASGLYAVWSARQLAAGRSFGQICEGLKNRVVEAKVFFYMDTLKYLEKGGRIGKVTSMVGTLLSLKPIISCDEEGIYYTVAKIRGGKKGKERIVEEAVRFCSHLEEIVTVKTGRATEEAAAIVQMLEEKLSGVKVHYDGQIAPTLALNTGPGLIGIAVLRRQRTPAVSPTQWVETVR